MLSDSFTCNATVKPISQLTLLPPLVGLIALPYQIIYSLLALLCLRLLVRGNLFTSFKADFVDRVALFTFCLALLLQLSLAKEKSVDPSAAQ